MTRLLEGRFVTDHGSELRRVFLLAQRDHYSLPKDELGTICNRDVDDFWSRAFSFYVTEGKDRSIITLSHQIDGEGEEARIKPFQSLFYCRTREVFFHPPCPECGQLLEQSYDDDLLTLSGLQPYSTSLRRYLFCPSCYRKGGQDFYVYELQDNDPPFLKDRWTLMKEFGNLSAGADSSAQFPCSGCPRGRECYGPDPQVLSKMAPFSFYPFFLFMFEAMSLAGPDFLSLLSGVSLDELGAKLRARGELGRLMCLKEMDEAAGNRTFFLFQGEERHFLEILYLKLSFLGEVLEIFLQGAESFEYPGSTPSIDQIWVKLADQNGLLPWFYNFRTKWIAAMASLSSPQASRRPAGSSSLFSLGLIWFHALLTNRKQDIAAVKLSVKEGLTQCASDPAFSFEKYLESDPSPTFLPENLFWKPEGKKVDRDWIPLWERALRIGWSLVSSGLPGTPKAQAEEVGQELEALRREIKDHLFGEPRPVVQPSLVAEGVVEDGAIHGILLEVLKKWKTEKAPTREMPSRPSPKREPREVVPETVILSAPGSLKEAPSPSRRLSSREASSEEMENILVETAQQTPEKGKKEPPDEDLLVETVILGSQGRWSGPSPIPPKDSSAGQRKEPPKESEQRKGPETRGRKPVEEEMVPETVILGPDRIRDKNRK